MDTIQQENKTWNKIVEYSNTYNDVKEILPLLLKLKHDVRKKYKKEKSNFHKSYFNAYNNPSRNLQDLPRVKQQIDNLLTQGKLTPKLSDYYNGKIQALKDRGLL